MQRGRRSRPQPPSLECQSNTGTHERRRKLRAPTCPAQEQTCRCCWVQPPFCGALNAAIWRQESPGPGEAEDSAPRAESALLLPPIPFASPTWAAKGRGRVSPTTVHLVFSPSLGRGDVLAMCPSTMDMTISRQCLTYENDAAFRTGGGGRRVLCLASLHFPPTELPSLWFPDWVTWPGECRQPQPQLLPGGCCWHPGWESAAAYSQQKTELMTFSCLIS